MLPKAIYIFAIILIIFIGLLNFKSIINFVRWIFNKPQKEQFAEIKETELITLIKEHIIYKQLVHIYEKEITVLKTQLNAKDKVFRRTK